MVDHPTSKTSEVEDIRLGHHGFSYDVVVKTVNAILWDHPDRAEEARQIAVLKLLEIPEDKKIDDKKKYASQVARNKANDQLRELKRHRKGLSFSGSLFDERSRKELWEAVFKIYQSQYDARRRRERREFIYYILETFSDQLDATDQIILDLIAEGFSRTKIAVHLEIDRKTVYNRINRIKERFAKFEPPDPEFDPPDPTGGRDPPSTGRVQCTKTHAIKANSESRGKKPCRCRQLAKDRQQITPARRRASRQYLKYCTSRRKEVMFLKLLSPAEREDLLRQFKALFLELPAFRGPNTTGPRSLKEIEVTIGAASSGR